MKFKRNNGGDPVVYAKLKGGTMAKLAYGGYGHNPSGRQYVYWVGDSYRTGQNVVAPVTDWRTGKTYRTMFTISRTTDENSKMAQGEEQRLAGMGINIKAIDGRDVMSLPGAKDYPSAAAWRRSADMGATMRWNDARTRVMQMSGQVNRQNLTAEFLRRFGR